MLINHLRTALRGLTRAKTHALINIGKKFATEERIGKVAGVFAALAILISCLGLFGMALFIAEQRTREIGEGVREPGAALHRHCGAGGLVFHAGLASELPLPHWHLLGQPGGCLKK
jgi:hypothetical protein